MCACVRGSRGRQAIARHLGRALETHATTPTPTPHLCAPSGSLAYLEAKGCNIVGVETDGGGLVPERLEALLSGWDAAKQVRVSVGRRARGEGTQVRV